MPKTGRRGALAGEDHVVVEIYFDGTCVENNATTGVTELAHGEE
jgi:hypothetical protein